MKVRGIQVGKSESRLLDKDLFSKAEESRLGLNFHSVNSALF